jgi:preprotein translocase subunit SecB
MAVKNQPRLNFKGVDVHSVNVLIFNQYSDAEIKQTIVPKISLAIDKPENFTIIMDVNLEAEGFFKIDVSLLGHFILNLDAQDEHKKIFMHTNAPAIMFPYVRSFISTLTANLGSSTGTIIIPPQVFKGDIDFVSGQEPVSVE